MSVTTGATTGATTVFRQGANSLLFLSAQCVINHCENIDELPVPAVSICRTLQIYQNQRRCLNIDDWMTVDWELIDESICLQDRTTLLVIISRRIKYLAIRTLAPGKFGALLDALEILRYPKLLDNLVTAVLSEQSYSHIEKLDSYLKKHDMNRSSVWLDNPELWDTLSYRKSDTNDPIVIWLQELVMTQEVLTPKAIAVLLQLCILDPAINLISNLTVDQLITLTQNVVEFEDHETITTLWCELEKRLTDYDDLSRFLNNPYRGILWEAVGNRLLVHLAKTSPSHKQPPYTLLREFITNCYESEYDKLCLKPAFCAISITWFDYALFVLVALRSSFGCTELTELNTILEFRTDAINLNGHAFGRLLRRLSEEHSMTLQPVEVSLLFEHPHLQKYFMEPVLHQILRQHNPELVLGDPRFKHQSSIKKASHRAAQDGATGAVFISLIRQRLISNELLEELYRFYPYIFEHVSEPEIHRLHTLLTVRKCITSRSLQVSPEMLVEYAAVETERGYLSKLVNYPFILFQSILHASRANDGSIIPSGHPSKECYQQCYQEFQTLVRQTVHILCKRGYHIGPTVSPFELFPEPSQLDSSIIGFFLQYISGYYPHTEISTRWYERMASYIQTGNPSITLANIKQDYHFINLVNCLQSSLDPIDLRLIIIHGIKNRMCGSANQCKLLKMLAKDDTSKMILQKWKQF